MKDLTESSTPFEVIHHVAGNVLECASRFRELAAKPEGRVESRASIFRCKRKASANRTAAVKVLDRCDSIGGNLRSIGRMIELLSRIPSLIEEAAVLMENPRIKALPGEILELGRCIEEASWIVPRASEPVERNDPVEMAKRAADLRGVVAEADRIGTKGLSALFETSTDPLEILKLKDLYHLLGEILRRFHVMAGLIEDMAQGAE